MIQQRTLFLKLRNGKGKVFINVIKISSKGIMFIKRNLMLYVIGTLKTMDRCLSNSKGKNLNKLDTVVQI